ncbi:MAG: hypothetical protein J0I21_14985 [Alphaproteobacteria bacterium]|nr:hypothetical protein [Alphaproteobacteria bacterium]
MSGSPSGRAAALPAASAAPVESVIGGRFAVDLARPLAGAGGGLPAYAALDRLSGRDGLMAVLTRPEAPPRAAALTALTPTDPGLLAPLGHGPAPGPGGRPGWFVVCPAPPGPPLWPDGTAGIRPWTEAELLAWLLRPAALALEHLRAHGLTHRAIRPGNLFRTPAGAVVLGCAWAAPPALMQPAAFEPPYVAMCLPAGRGEGSIADDVYALGVVMVALALGRMPWAGLAEEEVIRRKLEFGSFAALTQDARLPPGLTDLARAMLAEEPQQRPAPALLADPAVARTRRVAARQAHRAQRPLELPGLVAWDARMLAYGIAREPLAAARLMRKGVVDHWLRRGLEDATLAARVEELLRRRVAEGAGEDAQADRLLAMRSVALLDPLAPPCWGGVAIWPDGLGAALAGHATEADAEGGAGQTLTGLVAAEGLGAWAAAQGDADEPGPLRQQARAQRALLVRRGWVGGRARLRYELNALLACRSPALGGQLVVRAADLLPALEAAAQAKQLGPAPLDAEIVAFLAARQDARQEGELAGLADGMAPERGILEQVRVLAKLQARTHAGPLPHLAAALAGAARPALEAFRGRTRRIAKQKALEEAAGSGDLGALLAVLDDRAAREADAAELRDALAVAGRIDGQLAALAAGGAQRATAARALGQEVAAAGGIAALAVATMAALLA